MLKDIYDVVAHDLGIDGGLLEEMGVTIEDDEGSSSEGAHYGYFVNYPEFSTYDKDTQDYLKETLGDEILKNIPFGATINYTDAEIGDSDLDPFGWGREEKEHLYYLNYVLPKEVVEKELREILEKIETYQDELVKTALLFAAFSIVESYQRGVVVREIKNKCGNKISNTQNKKLKSFTSRKKLYLEYTNRKLEQMPYWNPFRNSLAHDIGKAKIIENNITVENEKKDETVGNIKMIVESLLGYIEKLDEF